MGIDPTASSITLVDPETGKGRVTYLCEGRPERLFKPTPGLWFSNQSQEARRAAAWRAVRAAWCWAGAWGARAAGRTDFAARRCATGPDGAGGGVQARAVPRAGGPGAHRQEGRRAGRDAGAPGSACPRGEARACDEPDLRGPNRSRRSSRTCTSRASTACECPRPAARLAAAQALPTGAQCHQRNCPLAYGSSLSSSAPYAPPPAALRTPRRCRRHAALRQASMQRRKHTPPQGSPLPALLLLRRTPAAARRRTGTTAVPRACPCTLWTSMQV